MPVTPKRVGRVGSAVVTFVVVSVLMGLVAGALVLPYTLLASSAARQTHEAMQLLPAELEIPPESQRSVVLDDEGKVLATFYDENRIVVPLAKISPIMQKAIVAVEDHRFFKHGAFDPQGTFRALLANTASGSIQGGGSSLTQQYVKMVQVEKAVIANDKAGIEAATETTIQRKIQELRYAIALETKFSKKDILERYLNIAYFGDGAYGVQAAAVHYFGVGADKLSLDQAAMLAGLVQNPDASNPVDNPKAAISRRNTVLDRMANSEIAAITKDQAEQAKKVGFDAAKVRVTPNGCISSEFPFLCDYVRRSMLKMPTLGKTPNERENLLKRGGLIVRTKINRKSQRSAEQAVAKMIGPKDPVIGAMVMMEPGTGLITAMAQSRPKMGDKPGETYYNYNAARDMGGAEGFQSGSTFKPITIAAALEKGVPIAKRYNASSRQEFSGKTFMSCGGPEKVYGSYRPTNSTISAPSMDMRRATAMSVNTYFIHLSITTGLCNIVKTAEKLGIEKAMGGSLTNMKECSKNPENCPSTILSLTLGSLYVTPLSMAEAYNTFAARGVHCDPVIIDSITTLKGKKVPVENGKCKQTLPAEVADGVNSLLQGVMQSGTGRIVNIPGGYPQAGKTGTTDSNAAVWFAGYTPELTGVAMIAVDNNNPYWKGKRKSLRNVNLSTKQYLNGSGSGDAGRIYTPAMTAGLKGKPKTQFASYNPKKTQSKMVSVPDVSGMSPSDAQAKLEAAGFSVLRVRVYSNQPAGTYLGITPQGRAEEFGDINMIFSAGPRPQPTPTPSPTPGEPTPPKPPATPREGGGGGGRP